MTRSLCLMMFFAVVSFPAHSQEKGTTNLYNSLVKDISESLVEIHLRDCTSNYQDMIPMAFLEGEEVEKDIKIRATVFLDALRKQTGKDIQKYDVSILSSFYASKAYLDKAGLEDYRTKMLTWCDAQFDEFAGKAIKAHQ